ncbi:MAG: hypothetical protein CM15mP106_1190 [Candidatus Neomarinimicrobiota bacterium]|nr:MAG: hypothetical protein CM15mP106_1190 [Candidatus Neomarinimicrobiota bacterium]
MLWMEHHSNSSNSHASTKIQKFNQYGDAVEDPLVVNSDTRSTRVCNCEGQNKSPPRYPGKNYLILGEIDSYGSPV